MSGGYLLYGGRRTGAVAVEAALVLMGQPYELPPTAEPLAGANPLRQAPTLVLPGGEVMTESAAILLRLAELHPAAGLAPAVDDPGRGQFLRWMSFVSSAIYAHYWVKDDPFRLVADKALHDEVDRRIEARVSECWAVMGAQTDPGLYIQGDQLSVLDVYVAVVSRFRPRRQRFYEAAPRLEAVVRRIDADPRLASLWAERFPFSKGWEDPPTY